MRGVKTTPWKFEQNLIRLQKLTKWRVIQNVLTNYSWFFHKGRGISKMIESRVKNQERTKKNIVVWFNNFRFYYLDSVF